MEGAYDSPDGPLDWNELRSKLHLSPEPSIDPETVELEQFHLSRLGLVPLDRLDDDRLPAVYRLSAKWGIRRVRNQVSRLLDQRPSLLTTGGIEIITLYGDLAFEAAHDGDRAQAEHWLNEGAPGRVAAETLCPLDRLGHGRPASEDAARHARCLGSGACRDPGAMSR